MKVLERDWILDLSISDESRRRPEPLAKQSTRLQPDDPRASPHWKTCNAYIFCTKFNKFLERGDRVWNVLNRSRSMYQINPIKSRCSSRNVCKNIETTI